MLASSSPWLTIDILDFSQMRPQLYRVWKGRDCEISKGEGCSCTPRQQRHTIIGIWLSPWKQCGHISFLLFEESPRMSSSLPLWHLLVRVKWNLKMKQRDTGTLETVIKWPDWLNPPMFTATEQPESCPRWPTAVIITNRESCWKTFSESLLWPGSHPRIGVN